MFFFVFVGFPVVLFLFIDRNLLFSCIVKHFQINLIITPWKLIIYQDNHSWLTSWCSEPVSTRDVCQLYHCSFYHPSVRQILVFVACICDVCNNVYIFVWKMIILLFCGILLMIFDASPKTWGSCIRSVARRNFVFIWDPWIFTFWWMSILYQSCILGLG